MKALVVIAYDIKSNRRRSKVAKLLESNGERVNYSVFELILSGKQIDHMTGKLTEMIHHRTDKVLVYKICRRCIENRIEIGSCFNNQLSSASIILL
jgi:CRISPR-associated protein Cas2